MRRYSPARNAPVFARGGRRDSPVEGGGGIRPYGMRRYSPVRNAAVFARIAASYYARFRKNVAKVISPTVMTSNGPGG